MLRIKQHVPENSENDANSLLENNNIEYYSKISKVILGERNYLISFNLQIPLCIWERNHLIFSISHNLCSMDLTLGNALLGWTVIVNYWPGSLLHRCRPCSRSMWIGFHFFLDPGKVNTWTYTLILISWLRVSKLQIQGIKPKINEMKEKWI